ncbi:RNA-binding S4 domain-containing protein [Cyanobium sp. ATX 6F1]|nr:RNA-binding S4 domain-containing protein [Cyanobium sp. ATX 6F1]
MRFRLDQFLKWQGLVATGGEAKLWVQQGEVKVNGELEERRGRQLLPGDRVEIRGQTVVVPGTPAL